MTVTRYSRLLAAALDIMGRRARHEVSILRNLQLERNVNEWRGSRMSIPDEQCSSHLLNEI
jgi:hypothetical protein